MKNIRNISLSILFSAAFVFFFACSGSKNETATATEQAEETPATIPGFNSEDGTSGTIVVNATSYTNWQYIDLKKQTITAGKVGEAAPEEWDIALHRFDVKTNGGLAVETSLTEFDENLTADFTDAVADSISANKIITDMSGMMQGEIKYTEDSFNPVLCRWLQMDMRNMPPKFNLSGKVYLLKLPGGNAYALRFTNHKSSDGEVGFVTLEYNLLKD